MELLKGFDKSKISFIPIQELSEDSIKLINENIKVGKGIALFRHVILGDNAINNLQ